MRLVRGSSQGGREKLSPVSPYFHETGVMGLILTFRMAQRFILGEKSIRDKHIGETLEKKSIHDIFTTPVALSDFEINYCNYKMYCNYFTKYFPIV